MKRWINRRELLGRSTAAGLGALLARPAEAAEPLKACLVSGSKEYRSAESLAWLHEHLERSHPVRCSRVFGEDRGTGLPGLEALAGADVMVLFARRVTLPPDQLRAVQEFCRSGRGIVGIRTASHAFQNWPEYDREVQGGNYKGHFSDGPACKVSLAEGAGEHPVLAGVRPFSSPSKLYRNTGLAGDVTLLLNGDIPDHHEPVAWTRSYGKTRVFYTSLGGPEDFQNETFRRLVLNALFWAGRRSEK
jgi:type 1 glutamine amidotransferase